MLCLSAARSRDTRDVQGRLERRNARRLRPVLGAQRLVARRERLHGPDKLGQQRAHVERLHVRDVLEHAPAAIAERERRAGAHGASRGHLQADRAVARAMRRIAALVAAQVVRRGVRDHVQLFRVAEHRRRVELLGILDEALVVDEDFTLPRLIREEVGSMLVTEEGDEHIPSVRSGARYTGALVLRRLIVRGGASFSTAGDVLVLVDGFYLVGPDSDLDVPRIIKVDRR